MSQMEPNYYKLAWRSNDGSFVMHRLYPNYIPVGIGLEQMKRVIESNLEHQGFMGALAQSRIFYEDDSGERVLVAAFNELEEMVTLRHIEPSKREGFQAAEPTPDTGRCVEIF